MSFREKHRQKPHTSANFILYPLSIILLLSLTIIGLGALAELGVFGAALAAYASQLGSLTYISYFAASLGLSPLTFSAIFTAITGFFSSLITNIYFFPKQFSFQNLNPATSKVTTKNNKVPFTDIIFTLPFSNAIISLFKNEKLQALIETLQWLIYPTKLLSYLAKGLAVMLFRLCEIGAKKDNSSTVIRFLLKSCIYILYQFIICPLFTLHKIYCLTLGGILFLLSPIQALLMFAFDLVKRPTSLPAKTSEAQSKPLTPSSSYQMIPNDIEGGSNDLQNNDQGELLNFNLSKEKIRDIYEATQINLVACDQETRKIFTKLFSNTIESYEYLPSSNFYTSLQRHLFSLNEANKTYKPSPETNFLQHCVNIYNKFNNTNESQTNYLEYMRCYLRAISGIHLEDNSSDESASDNVSPESSPDDEYITSENSEATPVLGY